MKLDHHNRRTLTLAGLTLGALSVLAGGCRGDRDDRPPRQFFPDMDDQPRWNVQTKSDFFADGRTMRQPVKGTVPFSRVPMNAPMLSGDAAWAEPFSTQRDALNREGNAFYTGKNDDGTFVAAIPMEVTKATILHGQGKFNIYCAPCHGYAGDGNGMVGGDGNKVTGWSYAVPSYHAIKYKSLDPADPKSIKHLDGFLFDTARNGVVDQQGAQKMPPYRHALDEFDAWTVVAYIRSLQSMYEGVPATQPAQPQPAASPAGGKS